MNRTRNLLKLFIFIAAVASIVTAVKLFGLDRYLEKEILRDWINGFGGAGPIAYVILFSITPSLFLPGLPVTVAGVLSLVHYGGLFTLLSALP